MTINEMINRVSNLKTLNSISKYADRVGVKLGNIKNVDKARNKVIKALEKEVKNISDDMVAYKQKTYDKAIKKYDDVVMKHNEKASQMVYYAMNKVGKASKILRRYLQGEELDLSSRSNITYKMSNTPFKEIEDSSNMVFSDVKAIISQIRRVENMTRKLSENEIDKLVSHNPNSQSAFEDKLQGFIASGDMTEQTKNMVLKQFNNLNGLQQEIFMNSVVNFMPDHYPVANDEKQMELETNIFNKLAEEMRIVSNYL